MTGYTGDCNTCAHEQTSEVCKSCNVAADACGKLTHTNWVMVDNAPGEDILVCEDVRTRGE